MILFLKKLKVFMWVTENGANLIKAFKVSVFLLKEKFASEPNLQLFHDPEDIS